MSKQDHLAGMPDSPEAMFSIASDIPAGVPLDALNCAIVRASAIVQLLKTELGEGGQDWNLDVADRALWAVEGYLAQIHLLIEHAAKTTLPRP